MAFTSEDEKRLAELIKKKNQAKQEERNEQKRFNRACLKYFGMSLNEVKDGLKYKDLAMRLCSAWGKPFESFSEYVERVEQKAREGAYNGQ